MKLNPVLGLVAPFPITGNINARAPDFTVIKIDYPDSGKPVGLPVFATGFPFLFYHYNIGL